MATITLKWDQDGERKYETGVDHVALFVYDESKKESKPALPYGKAVAWNGVTAISENPSGADANPLYADNKKYLNLISAEQFGATLEAYMSPVEFDACDGTATVVAGVKFGQQPRQKFCLVYRTKDLSDDTGAEHFKLHFVYGATAAPSSKNYSTVNESPEAMSLSWEISTVPVEDTYEDKTYTLATVTVGEIEAGEHYSVLEQYVYGDGSKDGAMPLPSEIAQMIKSGALASG